jgi:hypothetical protein
MDDGMGIAKEELLLALTRVIAPAKSARWKIYIKSPAWAFAAKLWQVLPP